jgi:hypothetical protein
MAIRFLDDITSEGSSTFLDNVSAQDFYAFSGHLMNSLCAVSAVLTELVATNERTKWNNIATIVSIGASKWDQSYSYLTANSGMEVEQQQATAFVLNNSANIVTVNEMILVTPHIITDGGFI